MYDINPDYFIQHAEEFLSLQNPDRIDLFLTNLDDDDYTSEGHDYYGLFEISASKVAVSKRERICTTFLPILQKLGLIQNCITCLCSQKPPQYEEALHLIHASKDEESLDWLLTLSDPSLIWNAALGSYDMDLAYLVAIHSQKDPQEYRSLLSRFKQMEEKKKRYCIDMELKRWPQLLRDIRDLLVDGDCIDEELGDVNSLWRQAVRLMKEKLLDSLFLELFDGTPFASQAYQTHAEFLMEKGKYETALREFQACTPQPIEPMMTCALHLGRGDLYLTLLFASQPDSCARISAIRRLCDSLRTGPREHIRQCAQISVQIGIRR